MRREMHRATPGEPVYLRTRSWNTATAAHALFTANDYEHIRDWRRMRIDMDAPPPVPTWPNGISVRTLDLGTEVETVHVVWEEAQADEFGFTSLTKDEWQYYMVDNENGFDPTLWFLAVDDATHEIVGYVLSRLERPGVPEVGHIRYVAVRPAHRRRGMTRALLLHAFGEFYRRGRRAVGLAVDSVSPTGADRLYDVVGMRPIQRSHVYERVLREATPASAE